MNNKVGSRASKARGSLLDKVLIACAPFKDAVGVTVLGIPLRIGEIINLVYGPLTAVTRHRFGGRIRGWAGALLVAMTVNFIIALLVGLTRLGDVDQSFFVKYVLRNALNVILVLCVIVSETSYDDCIIDRFMVWTLILQVAFMIFEYTTGKVLYVSVLVEPHYMPFMSIPRFSGTASEAAYIAPTLSMLFYYFCRRQKRAHAILSLVLMVLTFSSFGYFALLCVILMLLLQSRERHTGLIVGTLLGCLLMALVMVGQAFNLGGSTSSNNLMTFTINKIVGYLTNGTSGQADWSASDRLQQQSMMQSLIAGANLLQLLFGRGTGATSQASTSLFAVGSGMYSEAEEGYNLYLSTVVDRGLVGIFLLGVIIVSIVKLRRNSIASLSLEVGILVQFLHFFLTGNLWQSLLWTEIVLLLGYSVWFDRRPDGHTQTSCPE